MGRTSSKKKRDSVLQDQGPLLAIEAFLQYRGHPNKGAANTDILVKWVGHPEPSWQSASSLMKDIPYWFSRWARREKKLKWKWLLREEEMAEYDEEAERMLGAQKKSSSTNTGARESTSSTQNQSDSSLFGSEEDEELPVARCNDNHDVVR